MKLKQVVLGVCFVLALLGCDEQKIAKLEEGLSTEMDVMKQFGTPVDITREADGSRIFEYTRQPEGTTNYFITIDADGKMSALRQVLHPKYFAKVKPGMGQAEVRRLLGQPAQKQSYALKNQDEWTWRWQDGQTRKVFIATFDADGMVVSADSTDDPRDVYVGGK